MADTAKLTGLFLDYLRVERQYSDDTQKAYRSDINEFERFLIETGDQKTVDITAVDQYDVRVYLSALYEKGDVSRTIARKVSSLRAFYQFLERNEFVASNPFAGVQTEEGRAPLCHVIFTKKS